MADIVPLGTNWDLGFQSDTSRDELNPRAAYRMRDWIPQLDGPLRKRGGWSYASPDLSGLNSINHVASLGYLPFPGDGHVVAVGDTGSVFQVKIFTSPYDAHAVTDTGDMTLVPSWPVFWHKTGIKYYGIILPGMNQGAKVPKRYYDTGSLAYTVAPLGGTPPMARMGFSWGDYLVLGNYYDPSDANTLKNYRWAFSTAGNPDSWSLSGVAPSTIDFREEIVGGLPVLNSILAFGYENCWIITGDTPPPGGNLSLKILFAGVGTFDGRTVMPWRNYAIWANSSGVFQSDGATLTDITAQGGISNYYQALVSSFAAKEDWNASATVFRDRYILTIRNPANVVVATLVCDLNRRVWSEWTNINASSFAHRPSGPGGFLVSGGEELFFGHRSAPRVCSMSSLWTPSLTYAGDADGTDVLPALETSYFKIGALQPKRVRRLYLGYDMRAGGASARMAVSFTTSPEIGAAYTHADNFDITTKYERRHIQINRSTLGVALKIAQSIGGADTRLYSIEGEAHPWESYR